jgi:hypothetical protein
MTMIVISKNITEHLNVILKYFSVKCVSSASKSAKVVRVLAEFQLYHNWSEIGV